MVSGIVDSQLISNAKPRAAEMVGSAFKIILTNHRPDYIRQLGFKGTILIERIFAELGLPPQLWQPRHVGRKSAAPLPCISACLVRNLT